jgi:hypothetical protein
MPALDQFLVSNPDMADKSYGDAIPMATRWRRRLAGRFRARLNEAVGPDASEHANRLGKI